MENFAQTLGGIQQELLKLKVVLLAEYNALQVIQRDPLVLQAITDEKNSLLAALNYYDKLRLDEEKRLRLIAPYAENADFGELWQGIVQLTLELKALNMQNGELMEQQMAIVNDIRKVISRTSLGQMVYGENGQSQAGANFNRLNINI